MKNIIKFLDDWSSRIMLPLVLVIFFKTCTTNGKIEKVEKDLSSKITTADSSIKVKLITPKDLERMLKIEGLKVEKRMIQSTDRKILDVNRQSEIDKEIQKLEKE